MHPSPFTVYMPYSETANTINFYISTDADIVVLENDIRQHPDLKTNFLEDGRVHLFKVPLNSSPIKSLFW